MKIVEADRSNLKFLTKLGVALWPEHEDEEMYADFQADMALTKNKFLLAQIDDDFIGFIHISIRSDYVEGSATSPVGYIEGIYVTPEYRKSGVARKLVTAGEKWAKTRGCIEMASDMVAGNTTSYEFHTKIGFQEAGRIVCFIKNLD